MTVGRNLKYEGLIELDNGESYTVEKIMEITGKLKSTINHRLDTNNHAAYVLATGNSPQVVTLSDGKMYTKAEMMELSGATERCISNRLYRSKEIDYVLKPQRTYNYNAGASILASSFIATYGEVDAKVFKLLFGKW